MFSDAVFETNDLSREGRIKLVKYSDYRLLEADAE
jgi:hypothetical protein